MNSKLLAKAVTLTVAPRSDGSYDVGGSTAIYRVHQVDDLLFCGCTAGRHGKDCSHALAVSHHLSQKKEAT
jgi:hypothetical protein